MGSICSTDLPTVSGPYRVVKLSLQKLPTFGYKYIDVSSIILYGSMAGPRIRTHAVQIQVHQTNDFKMYTCCWALLEPGLTKSITVLELVVVEYTQ